MICMIRFKLYCLRVLSKNLIPSLPNSMQEIIIRKDVNIKHAGIITSIQMLEVIINRIPPIINIAPNADMINIQTICSYAVA